MTFIIAIQLNDSIIITADNKTAEQDENAAIKLSPEIMNKVYTWDKGFITGTGEYYVITRTIEFFKKLTHSNLHKLGDCLEVSKQLRTLEIGLKHDQVINTKLLCSSYCKQGAQLYTIQRFDDYQKHIITPLNPMQIVVWLFHPNVDTITSELQNLYLDLKDFSCFEKSKDWIIYYLNLISPIYQKQSLQDPLMSKSFDFFFQTKDEYFYGHIPNTQNIPIKP